MTRKSAIAHLAHKITACKTFGESWADNVNVAALEMATIALEEQEPKWIPCSERLPEDLEPVNITWVNHHPESYYADIKDKPFTATGHYCNGRWWWFSATCQDYLDEYGESDVDDMSDDIEVIAWMPLPKPWRKEE